MKSKLGKKAGWCLIESFDVRSLSLGLLKVRPSVDEQIFIYMKLELAHPVESMLLTFVLAITEMQAGAG